MAAIIGRTARDVTVNVVIDDAGIITGQTRCTITTHRVDGHVIATVQMDRVARLLRRIADHLDLMTDVEDAL